ncbi:MAG: di-heme oxidoredictase family protein [Candidatus Acidiferrum sp.]
MILRRVARMSLGAIVAALLATGVFTFGQSKPGQTKSSQTRSVPVDPGVRGGPAGGGTPLKGLTADETAFFQDGMARFQEIEVVTGGANNGLGPRFNSNQCFSCHSQPAIGGTSPAQNPLPAVATLDGAKNAVPWFITQNGPIREARFKKSNGLPDGDVHDLFVITGRADASGCNIKQFDFLPAGNPLTGQGGNANIIFRIPTPLFGAGLIESIPDSAILANMKANASAKAALGISGHVNAHLSGNVNVSANDGTITRFGWKAQNKSLLLFASEAYNVEMGITNELFQQERDETPGCLFNATPEDTLNFSPAPSASGNANTAVISDIEAFANFMRMLAPPTPAPATPSTEKGRATFAKIGCVHCHTPSLTTGAKIASGSSTSPSVALSNQTANLYSDLIVHHMGKGLADGITQGAAGPDEFRSAPLWGVGQRVFFLHDGRTTNLLVAIRDHRSVGSEANKVIDNFNRLTTHEQQEVIDFLRSL